MNVRRLFISLKESIDEGTQLTVFEARHEQLRDGAPQTSTFLSPVWRELRAHGTTPEEAFFVKCNRTTMTKDDIDNGRLICHIGVAPVTLGELVIRSAADSSSSLSLVAGRPSAVSFRPGARYDRGNGTLPRGIPPIRWRWCHCLITGGKGTADGTEAR